MDCDEIRDRWIDLLEEGLDPVSLEEARRHLASCRACSIALERHRAMRAVLTAMPGTPAPAGLRDDVRRRIAERARVASRASRRRALVRWIPRVAGALAAGVLLALTMLADFSPFSPRQGTFELVLVDDEDVFGGEDLVFKDMLDGAWALGGASDPVSLYADLLKDRGR